MQRYRHRLDRMVCDEKGEYVHVMDISQLQAKLARLRWKLVSEGPPKENGKCYRISNGIWTDKMWYNGGWVYQDSTEYTGPSFTHFREIILPGEEGSDE